MEATAQTGFAEIVLGGDRMVRHVSGYGPNMRFVQAVDDGDDILLYIHPDDADLFELVRSHVRAAPGGSATVVLRWLRAPERWSKVLATLTHADFGNVLVALASDDAAVARRAETQMRRAVEGSAQGIVVRTRADILYMNDSFARLLGYASARECMADGPGADGPIHPDDLPIVAKHLQARLQGLETVSHYEFRLRRRDGSMVWVETYAALVDWDGQPASLSWLNDISHRKSIEAELVASKEAAEFANRTKTEFLANMSHELRTPLNAILGFSEMIAGGMFGPLRQKYVEYARDIHHSGTHLLELVNDVLDLSKLEAGKLELRETEIDVDELVSDCLVVMRARAEEGAVELRASLPSNLPRLRADRRAVKQLLLNFLSNAVKFTPEGGAVTVATDCTARALSLSVADTGIGMSASEIEVALSPFGQIDSKLARKHQGTGLGLPICKSLVELHGGDLEISSRPGEGTTMTVHFPASRSIAKVAIA